MTPRTIPTRLAHVALRACIPAFAACLGTLAISLSGCAKVSNTPSTAATSPAPTPSTTPSTTQAAAQPQTPSSAASGRTPTPSTTSTPTTSTATTTMPQTPSTNAAPNAASTRTALFGAGCFWGVEAIFRKVPGVVDTAVGYAGGKTEKPSYHDVCTDATGHAEVVQVTYDPAKVSYAELVTMFFRLHDPTQLNRQGPDFGTQYRSAIFYADDEQRKVAEEVKAARDKSGKHKRPIVTEITKAGTFWRAEEYHQRYLEKNGKDNCHVPTDD